MSVTLKDIAEATGVSIGTVDRALKRRGRINPEVAERIRQKAEEMHYVPNRIASGLARKGRTCRIAVIYSIQPTTFWKCVSEGIQRAGEEIRCYGYTIAMYYGSSFDPQIQLQLIEQALAEGANALVIVPVNAPIISARLRQLTDVPVVFLNSYLEDAACLTSIHCDYFRSGRIAAALLQKLSKDEGHALAFLPSSRMLGNSCRKEGIACGFREHPGMVLDEIVELSMDPEKDAALMRDAFHRNPLANHVIFNGDLSTYMAVITSQERQFHTIVYDMVSESHDALLAGQLEGIITQDQEEQGYSAIRAVFQYLSEDILPPREKLMENRIVMKECID